MTHFFKGILKSIVCLALVLLITSVTQSVLGQTVYFSRGNGNWNNAGTWSLTGHTIGVALTPPQAGDIVRIGGGDIVTIPAGHSTNGVASVTVYNTNGNGTLIVGGTAAGAVTLNTGSLTVSAGGTLTVGNTFNATNRITATGDITVSGGTFTIGSANTATNIVTAVNTNISSGTLRIGGTNTGTNTLTSSGNLALSGTGILQYGNTGNSTNNLTINGDITINGTSQFLSAGDAGATNNFNFGGDITNNNTLNLSAVANVTSTAAFNGASAATLSGSGATFTFNGFSMNTTSSLNINRNMLINGILNFSNTGVMIPNSTSVITLGASATVTTSSTGHIRLDDTSSAVNQLLKLTAANVNDWRILYPIGTATAGYTPLDLRAASGVTMTTNPTNGSTLAVKSVFTSSTIGQMRRTFRLTVIGNAAATVFNSGIFSYNTTADVSAGDVATNYSTIWYLNLGTGSWTTLAGTSAGGGTFTPTVAGQSLTTGTYYYTIGISTAYPQVWYTYQSGNWSTVNVWTTDPSGTSLVNPLNEVPSFGDEVVILNGFTVTNDANNLSIASIKIENGATLDMAATTGNNLGVVTGTGLLRVNGVSLPSGTYGSFVSASTGGTIEYYNTTGTLTTTSQTVYNNLIFSNSTGSGVTVTTACNLTVNGDLTISATGAGTATWQINDGNNTQRTMTISGDLAVSANGQIRVGTGNEGGGATQPHNLIMFGNLTNNGSVKFFDATDNELEDADYTSGSTFTNEIQGNAVAVRFQGLTNNLVTCNSTTDFYRLILDKGASQQYKLQINSSSTANFRLFGPNNLGSTGTAPNQESSNSLSIANGTMELAGSINVPNMVEGGGSLPLPQNGVFWLNSSNVTVTVTSNDTGIGGNSRMLFVYGLLRVSNGTLNTGYSRGLLCAQGGQLLVEGGTINTWQLRTTNAGTGNNFAYIQTGGTVNVGTTGLSGESVTTFPRFALPQPATVFQMSGGTLNVASPSVGGTSDTGGIMINSNSSNIQVTGGTVNVFVPASATNFTITSNAPFYNLNIIKEGAGAGVAILNQITCNDGTGDLIQNAQPLVILNNLTLTTANGPTLDCNGNNVSVGGNFDMQSGTTFTPGANTITFNGSGIQNWTHNGTITSLNNVTIGKSAGIIALGGSNTFPNIANLTLTSGTINDGGKTITVTTSLTNNATHTSTGTGAIVYTNATASTITGSNGTFGNLTIQNGAGAALLISTNGSQTITGNLRITNSFTSLNIGSNALTVLGNIFTDNATAVAFSNTCRIVTNGLRNDGGLTRQAASGVDLLFPVGSSTILYTPTTINVTGTTMGTITVRPVKNEHPNVTGTPNTATVQYYWRVTSSGFSGVTAVTHKNYTFSNATKNGTLTAYVPARYNPSNFTWFFRAVTYNATGTTIITQPAPANGSFNTATGWSGLSSDQIDGEYTAGRTTAFGTVTVYYSRVNNSNWNTASNWSNDAARVSTSGSVPCSTCPVVIGDGASFNHIININANNLSSGSLQIASGSTLDCSSFTGLNFGTNTGEAVAGTGTLRIDVAVLATGNFPAGDFTSFIGSDGGTVEWYGSNATTRTIPATGPAPQNLSLITYKNLVINPFAGQTINLPASNLTIYGTLTKSGSGTAATNPTVVSSITIHGDLMISAGTLAPQNAFATAFALSGNTTVASGASFSVPGGGAQTHTFTTSRSFTNNGTVNFNNTAFVNITFTGTSNTSFTGTNGAASTTLNLVTINKGTSQTPVLTFDVAGTVTTLSNAWLALQNGTINFNKTGGTFILSNTATTYSIPSTAKLAVQNGTVNIGNIADDDADLLLNGALEITGGTVNIGVSTNNDNNDIEYAAAGTPTINVSGGTLYVNGAIRRPMTTLSGALIYNQTGGTVSIGGRNCDNNDTRGVFEIENNSGSNFILIGTSLLEIHRSTGGTSFADLYLNPVNSNVASTTTIQLGLSAGTQTLTANVVPSIGGFRVLSSTGNATTVTMQNSPMTTTGNLVIDQAGRLTTSSLDVNIGGNMTVNATGVYDGSGNTTTFNGTVDQNASLSSAAGNSFLHITVNKTSGTRVVLSGASPTVTNLNILSGELNIPSISLTVNGDIVNNSTQTGAGYVTLSGASSVHTITSSNGSFTNLRLGTGATTKIVTVEGSMTILGDLNFATTNRFLYIGGYRLTFGTTGSATGVGSSAFVRTNGASSDLGVAKSWPNTAGVSLLFVYPIGTMNSYTPVDYTLNVTTPGAITVVPVNKRHPSYGFSSVEQILNYYWIVTRDNSIVYSINTPPIQSHVYTCSSGLMGGSGGIIKAGYLNMSNPTGWITDPVTHNGGVSTTVTTATMTFTDFTNVNLPSLGLTFHYTMGTNNTLPNPIAIVYSRGTGGNWTDPNSWTFNSSGIGAAITGAPTGPIGSPIVVLPGATITMSLDSRSALSTQIDGTLTIGTTVGHDLGVISGTGILQTTTTTLPAGIYTAFQAATGGTIEYHTDPSLIPPVTVLGMNGQAKFATYNNLSITGTGTVTTTSLNITINGNLTIASSSTLSNSANNSNLTIAKNWANSGTYTAGTGTVAFNGSTAQSISGATSFNNLTISKAGVTDAQNTITLNSPTTVNNTLTLTTGYVASTSTNLLVLGSSATAVSGGSANSFISGPVRKSMTAGTSFTYPIGTLTGTKRYRPAALGSTSQTDSWTIEYVGSKHPNSALYNTTNIKQVSDFEYWNISPLTFTTPGTITADVTISYNTGSYYGSDVGVFANLRVVHFDGSQWDLPSTAGGVQTQPGTNTNIAGTLTITNVNDFSPFTEGSTTPAPTTTLPVKWISFTANRSDNLSVRLNWKVAEEYNNDHFEIERSLTGLEFFKIGTLAGSGNSLEIRSYQYLDTEASASQRHYYRIRQVDYDGNSSYTSVVVVEETKEEEAQRWTLFPNPVADGESIVLEQINPSVNADESVSVVVLSSNGQVVFQQDGALTDVSDKLEKLSTHIQSGSYIIKISKGNYFEAFKIVRH